jgi:hypothetical protein
MRLSEKRRRIRQRLQARDTKVDPSAKVTYQRTEDGKTAMYGSSKYRESLSQEDLARWNHQASQELRIQQKEKVINTRLQARNELYKKLIEQRDPARLKIEERYFSQIEEQRSKEIDEMQKIEQMRDSARRKQLELQNKMLEKLPVGAKKSAIESHKKAILELEKEKDSFITERMRSEKRLAYTQQQIQSLEEKRYSNLAQFHSETDQLALNHGLTTSLDQSIKSFMDLRNHYKAEISQIKATLSRVTQLNGKYGENSRQVIQSKLDSAQADLENVEHVLEGFNRVKKKLERGRAGECKLIPTLSEQIMGPFTAKLIQDVQKVDHVKPVRAGQ